MRKVFLWIILFAILGSIHFMIVKKENTLANGTDMLFRLLPRDPRSLMQGDYMVLRYDISEKVPVSQLEAQGCIVVSLDANDVARYIRVHRNEPLAPDEHLLFYKNRKGLRLGAESFYFQEGDAHLYRDAKYSELRVDDSGKSILIGLRGENLQPIGKKVIK